MASDRTSEMILEAFKANTFKSVFSRSITFKEAKFPTTMKVDFKRYIRVNPQNNANSGDQNSDSKEVEATPVKTKGKKKKNQGNNEYGFLDSLFDPNASKATPKQDINIESTSNNQQNSVINEILNNMKNTSTDGQQEPKRVKGKFQVEILSESANEPIQFNNNMNNRGQRFKQSTSLGEKWDSVDNATSAQLQQQTNKRAKKEKGGKLFAENDEWDEEYDQGKLKKIRHKEQRFMEKFENKNNMFQKEQDIKNYIKKKKLE
ncbi:hypothetical protein CONCODRAFT_84240 [Conidiobolus coronatus NRRL 28638]|uniref:Uncharacterized protein n=1 Tax=Conidiobolus coronatus (strain ATCC 28846 / CBS 209.66 / NRRL 28638) TaxID=796925 RepID=A0A137PAW0_CONC2|nr:hypothetical protein CONCODRAFT_84240 [Conidiobolus coronatus NRRL 28638]|eukprot:KXN72139.1 hypothetical protein CONCODRAFT_84240 [Conidiobolus coronatus NRRL 28638]